jgi:hypothetical protein
MKTLKIAMIALLAALTMAAVSSNAQVFKEKPKFQVGVCMTLENAIKIPGLVRAIYNQVHRQDVIIAHLHVYVAVVNYDGKVYQITGTFDQWMLFFLMDGGGNATSAVKYRSGGEGKR